MDLPQGHMFSYFAFSPSAARPSHFLLKKSADIWWNHKRSTLIVSTFPVMVRVHIREEGVCAVKLHKREESYDAFR